MYPLSSVQQEIWFDQVLHPLVPLYNIGGYVRIDGAIDPDIFTRAVHLVVQKNDSLRTILHQHAPLPLQEFPTKVPVDIPFFDFSQFPNSKQNAEQWMERELAKPFDLYDGILFRYALIRLSDKCYYWSFCYHHLVTDAWGISLIIKQAAREYNSLSKETGNATINNNNRQNQYSYVDFILDDRDYQESEKFKTHEQYWKDKFSNPPAPLIPHRYIAKFKGREIPSRISHLWLDHGFYSQLNAFVGQHNVTAFHFFLSALYCYFLKVTGTTGGEEMVVGLPLFNRNSKSFKQTAGIFVNMMPARFGLGMELNFSQLMQSIRLQLREDYRNQRFPISRINRQSGIHRDRRQQLFDLTFSFENLDISSRFGGSSIEFVTLSSGFEPNPLAVAVKEYHGSGHRKVRIDFVYNLAAFQTDEIEYMMKRFRFLLENAIAHPELPVKELEIIPEPELRRLLTEWNDTRTEFPRDKCIHQLFEEQVERTPHHVAVVSQRKHLTYAELNQSADHIAGYLIERHDTRPGDLVGIMVERGVEMIAAIMGILKSGAAYLPIDPDYPEERIDYMLRDSGANILLKSEIVNRESLKFETNPNDQNSNVPNKNQCFPCLVLNFEHLNFESCFTLRDFEFRASDLSPSGLAYAIYTSGSTGKPKGVMIT
ncbi:MAG: AMP-binding protein, partial [bacterium]|nr:AMP-binding protein [bacterium]